MSYLRYPAANIESSPFNRVPQNCCFSLEMLISFSQYSALLLSLFSSRSITTTTTIPMMVVVRVSLPAREQAPQWAQELSELSGRESVSLFHPLICWNRNNNTAAAALCYREEKQASPALCTLLSFTIQHLNGLLTPPLPSFHCHLMAVLLMASCCHH